VADCGARRDHLKPGVANLFRNVDLDQYCLGLSVPLFYRLEEVPMRTLALTILTMGIVLQQGTPGHRHMIRPIRFACTSSLSELPLTIAAAIRR
jgi:hypothetical protein